MADKFGLKLGLEGEKEFKSALSGINQSFKVLGSEMKLVQSQFDKNDNSMEALTARNTVLNKEIEAQKQKIETLRSALDNAAMSFGENDRRTQNWQIQLNNAEAALNGMERELDANNAALADAENGFDQAGDEAGEFGKELDKAGDQSEDAGGKFSRLGEVAATVGKAMAAAVAAIGTAAVAAGKQLWDMANTVAETGDEIDKMSQKIGISAESYQEWGYVFERCGTDVNNLQSGMKTLSGVITDAATGSDTAAKKLAAVGLSIEELNGKSQDEQLSIVIAALQGMESGAERTSAATDLLGKSATDLAAVLNMSAEETEALKREAQDYGMVMSNEAVAASAAFEDSLTKLKGTVGGFKNRMVGELLPGIGQIMDGFSDLAAGNKRAGEEIRKGVESVITTVSAMIPQAVELIATIAAAVLESAPAILSALAEGVISAIPTLTPVVMRVVTEVVGALVTLLPQIVEAGTRIIVSLIQGIAEALPTLIPQIVLVVTQIVQTLVENLPLILDAALRLITGLAEGFLAAIPVLIEALPNIISAIVDFLLGAVPEIIDTGIRLLTALVDALPEIIETIVSAIPEIVKNIVTAIIAAVPQIVEAGIKLLVALVQNLPQIISTVVAAIPKIVDSLVTAVLGSIPQLVDAGVKLLVALIQNLPQIITTVLTAIPQIISSLVNAIIGSIPQLVQAGVQLLTSLIQNLPQIISQIVAAMPQIIAGIVNALSGGISQMVSVGENLVRGLWEGIQSLAGWLWSKVSAWISSIWDGIMDFFGIHSPSRKMAWIGDMLVRGLAGSIEDNGDEAVRAAEGMSENIAGVMNSLAADMARTLTPEFNVNGRFNDAAERQSPYSYGADTPSVGGVSVYIESLAVREEADINRIAQKLYDLERQALRKKGAVYA